jgi:hypothetical protein
MFALSKSAFQTSADLQINGWYWARWYLARYAKEVHRGVP